jgi:SAM-dependent methyltransferase
MIRKDDPRRPVARQDRKRRTPAAIPATLPERLPDPPDIIEVFDDIESWHTFFAQNPVLADASYIRGIVDRAMTCGIASDFLGKIGPESMSVSGENYRETLTALGLNPRHRAIMELVAGEPWYANPMAARIYAAEALTPFALALRGRFPRFVGSEYASDEEARQALYPIPFQNLTDLTLLSNAFDCVITNDCLEHVPDIQRCLEEMARVLRPGGVMLSTFPFSFRYESIVKAALVNGVVEYFTEPEYHGNPAEPEKGSLVFEIPGWQILDSARAAGFAVSHMVFMSSHRKAITGAEIAGIFVLRGYKS